MIIVSIVGLVVLAATFAAGAYWVIKNVKFKQEKDENDSI